MKDIYVYGAIGDDCSDDCMTAHRFAYLMQEADGDEVTLHINSGGGDVFAANSMAEVIRAYPARVIASIEGLAASAASYFALTADIVEIAPSALLMIHNPWGYCQGEAAEMRKTADMLDKIKETIVMQYASKTGLNDEDIRAYMDAETWFDAKEAIKLGFCDGFTMTDEKIAACVDNSILAHFKNKPADLVLSDEVSPQVEKRDTPDTITEDTHEDEPEAQGAKVGVEATPVYECVNGMFLVK